jgi:hypothetical protein
MKRGAALVVAAAFGALAFTAQAQTPTSMPKDASWSLRLPKDEKVVYRGLASFDAAGAGGMQMMYPAPNLLVGIAAVLTHAAVASEAQDRQKRQIQETADRVLQRYQPVLGAYQNRELMQAGLAKLSGGGTKKLIAADAKAEGEWLLVSAPEFAMTQDQRAIILDNTILIFAPRAGETPTSQTVVRVVSRPTESDDLFEFWTGNEGRGLKEESAALFAHSLEIALNGASAGSRESGAQRTHRYMIGGTERMERAELLNDQCNRLVLRTLRGGLLSIPARDAQPDCKPQ